METNKQAPDVADFTYLDSRFLGELLSGTNTVDNLTVMIENITEGKNHVETARTLLSDNGATVSYPLLLGFSKLVKRIFKSEDREYFYNVKEGILRRDALSRLVKYVITQDKFELYCAILDLMIMYGNKIEKNTSK